MMLPEEFISRIKTQEYIDCKSLIDAFGQVPPVSIRINKEKWKDLPELAEQIPWCPEGYYLISRPSYTFDPLFHAGCYYPQEASSMFAGEAFRQVVPSGTDIRVLDLCGAPGGKSTHISTILGKNGFLVANEVIRPRAAVLTENLVKCGAANWLVTRSDPSAFSKLEGFFDVILVDAPCSGEGMFRDDTAINEWSLENTNLCSVRQRRILLDVWPALKEGGLLIYSTCTFNPGENEQNIRWLLQKESAVSVKLDISDYQGIKEIYYEGITGYGFHPGRIMGEGLFLSVLKKTGSGSHNTENRRQNKIKSVGTIDKGIVREWTYADESRLFSNGNEVWSLPCSTDEFTQLASALEIAKPGTAIFNVKGKDVNPAHDLALSNMMRKDVFPKIEFIYQDALKYLRKESPGLQKITGKWALGQYMGVNLGFMKNLGNRFNNYYPVEWRIRMSSNKQQPDIIRWEKIS